MSVEPTVQEALIYLMVVISAVDRHMADPELGRIGDIIRDLPVFDGFDDSQILDVAQRCQRDLQKQHGPETVLDMVRDTVPVTLHDTAYALAVEVAAADLSVEPEEKRMLQIVRRRLQLEPLVAVAIERAARARHRSLA